MISGDSESILWRHVQLSKQRSIHHGWAVGNAFLCVQLQLGRPFWILGVFFLSVVEF